MSARLVRAAEQDDAAFRARLAPLASEVLPPSPAASRRGGRRWLLAGCGLIAGIALSCAGWLIAKSPWAHGVDISPPVARIEAAPPLPSPQATIAPADPPAPSADMIVVLLGRGDEAIADGDVVAARLLYERAAGLGSARAAAAAGKTYDADFLARSGARGIRPDQSAAAAWFRKAAALGDPEARELLARIEGRPRP